MISIIWVGHGTWGPHKMDIARQKVTRAAGHMMASQGDITPVISYKLEPVFWVGGGHLSDQ